MPAGTDGIVRIRATCQGAPYPPGADNPSFRNGWFYPGDRGRIAPDGLIVLSGRTSDVINVGGLKLAPEVIEDVLRTHPAVSEVAAFGNMGDSGIEEISVALVANKPVADKHLIDWCAERGFPLTRVFIVEALPEDLLGKNPPRFAQAAIARIGPGNMTTAQITANPTTWSRNSIIILVVCILGWVFDVYEQTVMQIVTPILIKEWAITPRPSATSPRSAAGSE